MKRCSIGDRISKVGIVIAVIMVLAMGSWTVGQAVMTKDFQADKATFTKYLLATARAARTVYVKAVMRKAKEAGMRPSEAWVKEDHALMLPAQFIKALGKEIPEYELGLIGTDPLYEANAPRTQKEREMLARLASGKEKMVTFQDGMQFKGMAADFAITQGCADCHNRHPRSRRHDWKKGDFMGAIIVRMRG
ncbi:MAG: DUF3365 domain-containing protein [Nitrospirae bacterium]|nr:MAG: DUF3365 domain-containing protein [Nitrospirota bacterium]